MVHMYKCGWMNEEEGRERVRFRLQRINKCAKALPQKSVPEYVTLAQIGPGDLLWRNLFSD